MHQVTMHALCKHFVYMYICGVCMYVCTYVCMYVCVYVCVYVCACYSDLATCANFKC